MIDDGRWTMDDRRWTMDDGKMEGGYDGMMGDVRGKGSSPLVEEWRGGVW